MAEQPFQVHFRGVRGSIPTPARSNDIEAKLRYALAAAKPEDLESSESIEQFIGDLPMHVRSTIGGNSACLEMTIGGHRLMFDGGSGCFNVGRDWMQQEFGQGKGQAHVFITHTHLDHIMGLPMFSPLYVPGNQFSFYSPHGDLKKRLSGQQLPEYFPVSFESLGSSIEFIDLSDTKTIEIDGIKVSWLENDHPGRSFSYRVEYQGHVVVLSTDAEYKTLDPAVLNPVLSFFSDADVLIFDAQYGFTESVQLKRDWGHSSSFVGVDLALDAGVKKLALFHHEPTSDDFCLVEVLKKAQTYLKNIEPDSGLEIILAHEGLVLGFG